LEGLEVKGRIRTLKIKETNRAEYWNVNIVDCQTPLPVEILRIEEVGRWLEKWSKVFPREENLAWKYGVPSLIVRIDYTVGSQVIPYEIEDSPAGIGIASETVPGFKEKLGSLGWQRVMVIISKKLKGGDDCLWAEVIEDNEISKIRENCWLAPRTETSKLPPILRERAVWPVEFRENKKYLVDLELADEWDKTPLEKIVNEYANKKGAKGLVFKSDGARAERVKIVAFKRMTREIKKWLRNTGGMGVWTLGSIKEEVEKWKPLYIQPLHSPIKVLFNGIPMYGIFRIYFGFSVKERKWKVLGGFLNVRVSLLIHGASDALFIPIST
jgi:hypothetical protein